LGARAVRRLFPMGSHIPELAQGRRSAFAGPSFWPEPSLSKPPRPPLLFTRPEPVTVLAEIPEGPPAHFTWRHVTRRVVRAEGPERIAPEWWRNPSPSKGEGGDGRRPSPGRGHIARSTESDPLPSPPFRGREKARPRDYYRIEDEDGRRYWVFREGLYQESVPELPSWFMHGVFG